MTHVCDRDVRIIEKASLSSVVAHAPPACASDSLQIVDDAEIEAPSDDELPLSEAFATA